MRVFNHLLILLFSIPALLPLLRPGFFLSDDGEWMIVRLGAFFEALRSGQIPVRFLINLNYNFGYPLSDFAYPGFLYIGSTIHALGFGFIDSVKLVVGLSLILGSVFTYLFLRKRFDNLPALVGSFVYLYTPYHLYDVYKRGSVGELLAISVIPFLFYQIERKDRFLTAIGVFALILAHNSIALISLPFIFLYSIIINRETIRKNILGFLSPFILGVLMSAFFFIPSVYDLRYIVFQGLKIADWRLFFADLNIFGISSIVIFLLGLFIIFRNKKGRSLTNYFFIAIVAYTIIMGTVVGTTIWNVFLTSFIIFPFRFLSILPIGLAFLSALIVNEYKKSARVILAIFIIAISFYSTIRYIAPVKYLDRNDDFYLTNFATTTANDEYMPKWVKEKPNKVVFERTEVIKGKANINNVIFSSKIIAFRTSAREASSVRINAIYFPGWNAKINGKSVPIDYGNKNGLIEVNIPKGESSALITFSETPVRWASDVVSVLSFLLVFIIFIKEKLSAWKNR